MDFTLSFGPSLYTDEVPAHFDLVGFDPRGIALGTRLQTLWQRQAYLTMRGFPRYPNDVEGSPAVFCADSERNLRRGADAGGCGRTARVFDDRELELGSGAPATA